MPQHLWSQYALQTITGITYVTAVGGGGLVVSAQTPAILQTDRTQVRAWEKFRLWNVGDGTYGIQTVSGGWLAPNREGIWTNSNLNNPMARFWLIPIFD